MTQPLEPDAPANNEGIDVLALFRTVRQGWLLILLSVALCVGLGIAYLHIAKYKYTAILQVTPAQQNSNDRGGGSSLGGLSGLASLAGINLSSSAGALQFNLYLEALKTREVADIIAKNQSLMRVLFKEEWDEQTHTFHRKGSGRLGNLIRGILGMPPSEWTPPNGARVQTALRDRLNVDLDLKKPYLATISYESEDPQFAVALLSALNAAADQQIRYASLIRAQVYIKYLSKELQTTTIEEMREAITQSLGEQEKYLMMASSAAPFAAQPFAGPVASAQPTSPSPIGTLGAAVAVGFVLGLSLIFLLDWRWPRAFAAISRIRLLPRLRTASRAQ